MENHNICWWNLENLFDIENSPRRSAFLNDNLKGELLGWSNSVLTKKLNNLTSIIVQMNNGLGPDILGVCEVENDHVLDKLTSKLNAQLARNYTFAIVDGADKRGIDTALIYDEDVYTVSPEVFTLRITKRNNTRDLFQVQLTTSSGNLLVLILNHWPSRSGGEMESEPYRIMVAENLAYWVERIHEEIGDGANIILMGDFNDNPYNRSMTKYLQSTHTKKKVMKAKNHYFYNLMYEFMDTGVGTHVYGNQVNQLDQFLVSKNILNQSNAHPFKIGEVKILIFPGLVKGDYNKAIRFSRPSRSDYEENGFSDHLPISLDIIEN